MKLLFTLPIDCPEMLEVEVYAIHAHEPRYTVFLAGTPVSHEMLDKYKNTIDRMVIDHAIQEGYV